MQIILNDFSLDGQFENEESFYSSLRENSIKVLKLISEQKFQLLKSYNFYQRKVTNDLNLYEIIQRRGEPEITRFKGLLSEILINPPYWEESKKQDENVNYIFKNYASGNNCLGEACERDKIVFSFVNQDFNEPKLEIMKDEKSVEIINIYRNRILLDLLYELELIREKEYFKSYFNYPKVKFCEVDEKEYTMEIFDDESLNKKDKTKIVSDFKQFMFKLEMGEELGRFSKNIYEDINEFRSNIDGREVRIFYFRQEDEINLLNGFIKKQQTIPKQEIEKAKRLRKNI